jgi:hypothetical protein
MTQKSFRVVLFRNTYSVLYIMKLDKMSRKRIRNVQFSLVLAVAVSVFIVIVAEEAFEVKVNDHVLFCSSLRQIFTPTRLGCKKSSDRHRSRREIKVLLRMGCIESNPGPRRARMDDAWAECILQAQAEGGYRPRQRKYGGTKWAINKRKERANDVLDRWNKPLGMLPEEARFMFKHGKEVLNHFKLWNTVKSSLKQTSETFEIISTSTQDSHPTINQASGFFDFDLFSSTSHDELEENVEDTTESYCDESDKSNQCLPADVQDDLEEAFDYLVSSTAEEDEEKRSKKFCFLRLFCHYALKINLTDADIDLFLELFGTYRPTLDWSSIQWPKRARQLFNVSISSCSFYL